MVAFNGQSIRALREHHKLTQAVFAAEISADVTRQAVCNWERGQTPQLCFLMKIADRFGVSMDYFFAR